MGSKSKFGKLLDCAIFGYTNCCQKNEKLKKIDNLQ